MAQRVKALAVHAHACTQTWTQIHRHINTHLLQRQSPVGAGFLDSAAPPQQDSGPGSLSLHGLLRSGGDQEVSISEPEAEVPYCLCVTQGVDVSEIRRDPLALFKLSETLWKGGLCFPQWPFMTQLWATNSWITQPQDPSTQIQAISFMHPSAEMKQDQRRCNHGLKV